MFKSFIKRLSVLFCALCLFTIAARADVVTISFDGSLSGNFLNQGVLLGTSHTNTAGRIVNFTGADVRFAGQAHTAPNAAFGVQLNSLANLRNNVSGEFYVNAGASTLPGSTNFVSFFVVGTLPGQTAEWTVRFYDDTSTGLNTTTGLLATFTGTADTQVVFTSDVGIRRFIFFPSAINLSTEGIDTLQFNTPAIPEPASLVLLGTGLVGTGLAARKRRRAGRPLSRVDNK